MELKNIKDGGRFKFPRPTALTGIYKKGDRSIPEHPEFFSVHNVNIPLEVFYTSECTEVIPVDE